jgi:hypothetical protein
LVHAFRVDPLLRRIEALNDDGYYMVSFVLADGHERSILMRSIDGDIAVPEANLLPGWPATSESFQAAVLVVRAFQRARETVGFGRPRLLDVPGGWDVGLGNVTLSTAGQPLCVSHGQMELTEPVTFECTICGARARYSDTP